MDSVQGKARDTSLKAKNSQEQAESSKFGSHNNDAAQSKCWKYKQVSQIFSYKFVLHSPRLRRT